MKNILGAFFFAGLVEFIAPRCSLTACGGGRVWHVILVGICLYAKSIFVANYIKPDAHIRRYFQPDVLPHGGHYHRQG